jgi:hypothetical protein
MIISYVLPIKPKLISMSSDDHITWYIESN